MKQNNKIKLSNDEINKITKNSIQEALITLLGKADLGDISVTQIVNKAGVSRSAYYRNYNSKEDILWDFSQNVFTLLFDKLNKAEYVRNPEAWYHFLFTQVKENERIVKLIFKVNFVSLSAYIPPIKEESYDKKELYQVEAMLSALISVVERWVNSDFDLSVDEISAICFELFPHINWLVKIKD